MVIITLSFSKQLDYKPSFQQIMVPGFRKCGVYPFNKNAISFLDDGNYGNSDPNPTIHHATGNDIPVVELIVNHLEAASFLLYIPCLLPGASVFELEVYPFGVC